MPKKTTRRKRSGKKTVKRAREKSPAERDLSSLDIRAVANTRTHRSHAYYGRSGSGKTTLSGSFPKNLLLLDVNDLGTDSISDIEGIEVVDIKNWDDFETVYWYLRKNSKKYKTVVIDTITQIQRLCVLKVVTESNKDIENAGDWGTMTKKDWGNVASLMKNWITNYRDLTEELGMEVVFVAQDRVFGSDDDEEETSMLMPEVGPQLSPAVVKHLNASVDVIGYTYIRRKVKEVGKGKKKREIAKTQYCLRIGPDPVYTTKIRKPKKVKLPGVLVDPTYDDIVGIIKGEA